MILAAVARVAKRVPITNKESSLALSLEESDDFDLLGPNVVRWVHGHKANHTRAVLDEQERQDRSGESNPYKIACVSQRYSQWSTIRAQRKRHITKSIENEPRG